MKRKNSTMVDVSRPRKAGQYPTPQAQKAQEDAMARKRGGGNTLTSVGGRSPERTEFEGR